jgi:hypothetical protein
MADHGRIRSRGSNGRSGLAAGSQLFCCGKHSDMIISIALHASNPNIVYVATIKRYTRAETARQAWERMSRIWVAVRSICDDLAGIMMGL